MNSSTQPNWQAQNLLQVRIFTVFGGFNGLLIREAKCQDHPTNYQLVSEPSSSNRATGDKSFEEAPRK
jgi:hypothetical protein